MKNSKKGISLIVLVITIIVVIILAAAVIISLQNNNPMTEANKARYSSDVANMQAVFVNAVGKAMADQEMVITVAADDNINDGIVAYWLGDKVDGDKTGDIIFGTAPASPAAPAANTYYTGKALPTYGSKGTWSIDSSANLKLVVTGFTEAFGPGAN